MRQLILSLTAVSMLSGCAGTYEHVAGGALVGGATGAMAGAVCCGNPGNVGKGAIAGIIVGALIGLAIDWIDPVK